MVAMFTPAYHNTNVSYTMCGHIQDLHIKFHIPSSDAASVIANKLKKLNVRIYEMLMHSVHKMLVAHVSGNRALARNKSRWRNNCINKIGFEMWIALSWIRRVQGQTDVNTVMKFPARSSGETFALVCDYKLLQKDPGVRNQNTHSPALRLPLKFPNNPSLKNTLIRQSERTQLSPDTSRRLGTATCVRGIRTKRNGVNRLHGAGCFFEKLIAVQLTNMAHAFYKPCDRNFADKILSLAPPSWKP